MFMHGQSMTTGGLASVGRPPCQRADIVRHGCAV
jgi:hypothetical protein